MTSKHLISTAVLCVVASSVSAAPISPEAALQRALQESNGVLTRGVKAEPQLTLTLSDPAGEATVYIFDTKDNTGYLVVSADDLAVPLLGYTDSGDFDTSNIPPALKYWLQEYSNQIQYVRTLPSASMYTRSGVELPSWDPISPLLKTTWNQTAPYNNMCPEDQGGRSVTGCVATSMAQVMKYFNYPEKGTGSVSYDWKKTVGAGKTETVTLEMDFSEITFDWENMLDSYADKTYSIAQANAVAQLMVAVGYSVEMKYASTESGAYSEYIASALTRYFGYNKNVGFLKRNWYQYSDWAQMIYDNLQNLGPVIYGGNSLEGAHSFVCDGYQSDGYFHFNWGWGGISDGYFLLDALNPGSLGTGAAGGGYNFTQDIVLGICKPDETTQSYASNVFIFGSIAASVNRSTLSVTLENTTLPYVSYIGTEDITFDMGIKVENQEDSSDAPLYVTSGGWKGIELQSGYAIPVNDNQYPTFNLANAFMKENVEYKITLMYLEAGTTDWKEIKSDVGYPNYCFITKSGQGNSATYQVKNVPLFNLTFDSVKLESELYYGSAFKYSMTISNNNDSELTRNFTIGLFTASNSPAFISDTNVVTFAPNETLSQTWVSSLNSSTSKPVTEDTEYYLGVYDILTGTILYKSEETVTMHPKAKDPVYSINFYVANGTPEKNLVFENRTYGGTTYTVEDPSDIEAAAEITVSSGLYSYATNVIMFQIDFGANNWVSFQQTRFPQSLIAEGETETLQAQLSYPDAEKGQPYLILPYALINNSWQMIKIPEYVYFRAAQGVGVEGIEADAENILLLHNRHLGLLSVIGGNDPIKSVEVYSINGSRLAPEIRFTSGNADVDLSSLGKGLVIVTATDSKGNRKTAKIAL